MNAVRLSRPGTRSLLGSDKLLPHSGFVFALFAGAFSDGTQFEPELVGIRNTSIPAGCQARRRWGFRLAPQRKEIAA